jgi:D-lactate dehydrogenase
MRVPVFSTKRYDREILRGANADAHELCFFEPHLDERTAPLAACFEGVCVFVNDKVVASVLQNLAANRRRLITLRCAGFNHVDLRTRKKDGSAAGLAAL